MEMYGSYPYTSIPREIAALATLTPIAPRPITPSFFPAISVPANLFFSFSVFFATSASSLADFAHSMPPAMSLAASNIPAITSSFTPLALAPGVLNTTIPCSAHFSNGILFTPAPALAIAFNEAGSSKSCMAALLTRTASASAKLSTVSYLSSNKSKPTAAIGFKQLIFVISSSNLSFCPICPQANIVIDNHICPKDI